MKIFFRLARYALYLGLGGALLGCLALGIAYWLISPRLPSAATLKDVRLQVPLKVLSADGKLMATFGETRRIPITMKDVPDRLKYAVLSAEDADFYSHSGIDIGGIARAVWLVTTTGSKHVAGGSTITQQVARQFFLSPEVTYTRKLSEIFLAFRIENAMSKDEILELYLNKSFFGNRAYGIAAAAEFYYGKTLGQLTQAECAMLASLPKFPSTGNPINNLPRAMLRRAYVLGRMLDLGHIDKAAYELAMAEPDQSFAHEPPIEIEASYVAELVRQEAIERLGNEALNDGYVIRTTIDSSDQEAANQALRDSLIDYDQRHGYRGAEAHSEVPADAKPEDLASLIDGYRTVSGLIPGVVSQIGSEEAMVQLLDGQTAALDLAAVSWARPYVDDSRRGPAPKRVDEVLKLGDIIRVVRNDEGAWQLAQIPAVQGAMVGLEPDDGAIRSMIGGFNFARSKYNRATQSSRSAGSSFKPFIYSAAFDHGFTPASVVNDAPLVFPDVSRPNGLWTPSNDDGKFDGPIRLREALVQSKNLVSVRLLDAIGVHYAHEYVTRFGFSAQQVPENLSMALGTAAVSPLSMARGYAVIANGGFLVDPYFIAEITDRDGKSLYRADPLRACRDCPQRILEEEHERSTSNPTTPGTAFSPIASAHAAADIPAGGNGEPRLAPRVIDARNAFLVTSLMRDVIRRGTGSGAMVLKRGDLAGKTGTTNEYRDAWFSGFNAKMVATAWVGFDDFSSLGSREFGAKSALPIWIGFMRAALRDMDEQSFDMPPGITTARVDRNSGLLAPAGDPDSITEFFKTEDVTQLATRPDQQEEEQREAYDVF
ncbi:penicillin-binding protein 1A [Dokdonella sp.]|uniref:penicillin-binding protein 1A n=1 Tax=Dokdonella sp. TaxID=2291710 RepID=UPI002CB03047|nr:penicillin-binding protein 1A [Dokdonella sp.]HOX70492.1 penicillin-binding protein 1A [Dokdonella sp.]HPN78230.1 penicillin-binding protein 1A [Dokdonella sp.]